MDDTDRRLIADGLLTEREAARLPQWAKRKIVRLVRKINELGGGSGDMTVVVLEDVALTRLIAELVEREKLTMVTYRLRVARDGDSVKFKVNEDAWTPPYPLAREQQREELSCGCRATAHVGGRCPVVVAADRIDDVPRLSQGQLELLCMSIRLEGPYAAGKVTQATYDAAYRAADEAGLSSVTNVLQRYFVDTHASSDEITATGRNRRTMRDAVEAAYDHVSKETVR